MWYIASMFSLDAQTDSLVHKEQRKNRYTYTRDRVAELIKSGTMAYSPIVHCYDMAVHNNLPKDYTFWKLIDRHMIDCSEGLLVLDMKTKDGKSWKDSTGMSDEIAYATSIGKPVVFLPAEDYQDISLESINKKKTKHYKCLLA